MKRFFHDELEEIRSQLALIGEKSITVVRTAMQGLLESDLEPIDAALSMDDAIDQLEIDIDQAAVRYVTLRAPVSSDARLLFVAIKASHDFERVGDEGHTVAKKSRQVIVRQGQVANTLHLREMSQLATGMLADAISSLVDEDSAKARDLIDRDKRVDELNLENITQLTSRADRGDITADTAVDLIFVSKSLERVADHAKNLAQDVLYLLSGETRGATPR